jgi:glycosyltransferase involved in cell wall biosynthesis
MLKKTSHIEYKINANEPSSDGNPSGSSKVAAAAAGPAILILQSLPKISVVTPSFNQGEYLEECMDSILSQNYPNLEYVVMDGGSKDRSVEIIKRFAKHLTHWQSRPDGGQYHAIQEGLDHTTGEIMFWLNSSDKLHPGSFDIVSQIFSQRAGVEWITGRHTCWNENGLLDEVSSDIPRWSREMYINMEPRNIYIQQESTFWRRSLWNRSGSRLDLELKHAGDFELWARFFRFGQLHTVDAMLGGFRVHPGQKTATIMPDYLAEVDLTVRREKDLFQRESNAKLLPAPPLIDIYRLDRTASRIPTENFSYFAYSKLPQFDLSTAIYIFRQCLYVDAALRREAERVGLIDVAELDSKLRECEKELNRLRRKKNLWIFNPAAWRTRSQRNNLRRLLDKQKQILFDIWGHNPKFSAPHQQ